MTDPSVRTFDHEERLPRVPLPSLPASCRAFLEWCAPLLTPHELAATRAAVASFLRPDGPAHGLQAALEKYDASEETHSWLDAFWAYRYLGRRDRIALNANFFCLFPDTDQGQVGRAAELVTAAVEYKLLLDEQRIPPASHRGKPLSMRQHRFLFSTTRIPGPAHDTVRAPYSEDRPGPSRERHIVVFHRGNAFRMEVISPDGRPYLLDELADGLRAVMAAGEAAPGAGVGHLTTLPRAAWAASRRTLLDRDPHNAAALDAIETALFCVCLEENTPGTTLEACEQLLHGDSGNRWFDTSLSFIVFRDGSAGANVEHSCLDGTTVVEVVDTLLDRAQTDPRGSAGRSRRLPPFRLLQFVLDPKLRADIAAAAASFADQAADTTTDVLSIQGFGRNRAKQLDVSPDAFLQLAYQLAHQRARGFLGATYESISTRHYRHGRTEAMRVVTPESVRFVAAMEDPGADAQIHRAAFRVAADRHVQRARECRSGDAPEQHLWELQLIHQRSGATEPLGLYQTPGWLTMREDHLSTSSIPAVNVRHCGFGPTGRHCIGIAYIVRPDQVDLHLSARRSAGRDLVRFTGQLRQAVGELVRLLSTEE